jgi:two-component system response regulator AtoC
VVRKPIIQTPEGKKHTMEGSPTRLLLVDDEPHFCRVMAMHLEDEGYQVITTTQATEALEYFQREPFHLIITDLKMPGMDGLTFLEGIRDISPSVPVIVLTAYGTVETAVQAMKLGAFDYILKPVDVDELKIVVARALHIQEITRENVALKASLGAMYRDFTLVAESPAMQKLIPFISKAAEVDAHVLIRGETGTGKELVARVTHAGSPRREAPFVVVDCAFLDPGAVEDTLFEKDQGKAELARGGTLLLDQVEELSLKAQARLLRYLEEQRKAETPQARVMATTTKNLEEMVTEGVFRQELLYRLRILEITVPPLRERKEDIPILLNYFLKRYSDRLNAPVERVSSKTMELLMAYPWPGNVRELENVIEGALALCEEGERILSEKHLPPWMGAEDKEKGAWKGSLIDTVESLEQELIIQALRECGGNQTRAAEKLGITRRMLQYKMKKYEIKAKRFLDRQ